MELQIWRSTGREVYDRLEWTGKWAEHNKYEPSTAQKMFGELVIEAAARISFSVRMKRASTEPAKSTL